MFLENLEKLMSSHDLNKHSFSVKSGIPYKTIDNFWKKGCDNIKLTTLKRIAIFFNVSLDYLIFGKSAESNTDITKTEKELIEAYRSHPEMQAAVNKMLDITEESTVGETVIKDIAGEMVLDVMNVIKQAKSRV